MGRRAKSYAYALLDTVDFLAESPDLVPQYASGLIEQSQLKRRLIRILSGASAIPLSWTGCAGLVALSVGSLLAGPRLAPMEWPYDALDLRSLGGGTTEGAKLNAVGQVVGRSETGEYRGPNPDDAVVHGFRTAADRPINPATDDLAVPLSALGPRAEQVYPSDINASGQVVLTWYGPSDPQWHGHGYRLDGDRLIDFATDRTSPEKPTATAINDVGQVVGVGSRSVDSPSRRPFQGAKPMERFSYRTPPNQTVDLARDGLGHLGGTDLRGGVYQTMAWDMNLSGQVVGDSLASNGYPHAFRTSPDRPINPLTDDLGTLGGKGSEARGVNDLGQVVGSSDRGDGTSHAFRTGPNRPINPMTDDLGTLGLSSRALAINNRGDVVGESWNSDQARHAFLFTNGRLLDLNTRVALEIGWVLEEARDINDRGQILAIAVGDLRRAPGAFPTRRTYVLTPVPDPTPLAMFLVGTVVTASGLAVARVKRKGAAALMHHLSALTNPNGSRASHESNLKVDTPAEH